MSVPGKDVRMDDLGIHHMGLVGDSTLLVRDAITLDGTLVCSVTERCGLGEQCDDSNCLAFGAPGQHAAAAETDDCRLMYVDSSWTGPRTGKVVHRTFVNTHVSTRISWGA